MSANNTQEIHNVTYEILGVNATDIYLKIAESYGINVNVNCINESKNMSAFSLDLNHHQTGSYMTYLGKETITTKWGARSTDYDVEVTSTSVDAFVSQGDYWMYNGIVVRFEWLTP